MKRSFLIISAFLLLIIFFSKNERTFWARDLAFSHTAFLGSIFSRASFATAGLWETSETVNHERIQLFSDAAELASLRLENEKLRAALRIGETTQKKVIVARVTGTGREIGDEYIVIDKGTEDGIGIEFIILGEEKLLLGRVVEVFSHASRVRLLSSPQEVVEVAILPSGIRAVSRGRQSGELSLDLVPRESDIAAGDAVTTSEQSRYGGGWVIGEVAYTSAPDNEVFQTVLAKHLFNPFSGVVFVMAP